MKHMELSPEEDKQLRADAEAERRSEIRRAFRCALRQWCRLEDNFTLNWPQRIFYTIKCLLCVLLRLNRPYHKGLNYCSIDTIVVAQHHYSDLYAGWEEKTIQVGSGLFRHWWFELCSDGDWWM